MYGAAVVKALALRQVLLLLSGVIALLYCVFFEVLREFKLTRTPIWRQGR
jgi:hypothetical protein